MAVRAAFIFVVTIALTSACGSRGTPKSATPKADETESANADAQGQQPTTQPNSGADEVVGTYNPYANQDPYGGPGIDPSQFTNNQYANSGGDAMSNLLPAVMNMGQGIGSGQGINFMSILSGLAPMLIKEQRPYQGYGR